MKKPYEKPKLTSLPTSDLLDSIEELEKMLDKSNERIEWLQESEARHANTVRELQGREQHYRDAWMDLEQRMSDRRAVWMKVEEENKKLRAVVKAAQVFLDAHNEYCVGSLGDAQDALIEALEAVS